MPLTIVGPTEDEAAGLVSNTTLTINLQQLGLEGEDAGEGRTDVFWVGVARCGVFIFNKAATYSHSSERK